jgi:hypothetical protein
LVSILKILWDGKLLTAEFINPTDEENSLRNTNKRKRQQLFEALADANDGDLLQTFQLKLNQFILRNKNKVSLMKRMSTFNAAQRTVFDIATGYISTKIPGQLIMLITGGPGDGKTYIAQVLCKYTLCVRGKPNDRFPSVVLDHQKHDGPFRSLTRIVLLDDELIALRQRLEGTVLIVIEDLNCVSLEDLHQISSRLCVISGNTNLPFGGYHVLMMGDLHQSSLSKLKRGTHIMTNPVRMNNTYAIAGQNILLYRMTHCVDISKGTHASLTGFNEHLSQPRKSPLASV